jgi:hypothetical protein
MLSSCDFIGVRFDFHINGHRFSDEFFVLENLSEQKWRFKLDFDHDEFIINPRVTRLRI